MCFLILILPVTEKYKIPMVEANGASRSLFTKGYKYLFAVLAPANLYLDVAVDLAHQGVDLHPHGFTLGKGHIAMLEFCCHFFLYELQSIVDELYFFGNAEFEQELVIAA